MTQKKHIHTGPDDNYLFPRCYLIIIIIIHYMHLVVILDVLNLHLSGGYPCKGWIDWENPNIPPPSKTVDYSWYLMFII